MNAVITKAESNRAVAPVEPTASDSRALMALIERLASSPDIDIGRIEKMLELKERWDANEARKAYTAAMAAFKADPPELLKDKHVKYTSDRTGKVTEYDHATLGSICAAIITGLSQHGISHRWDVAQGDGRIKVTCILTHAMGHSESVSLNSAPDDSGGKNSIQAIASAVTYLQRYTLLAATGLAPEDMEDDDGRGAGPKDELITPAQVESLKKLIADGGGDISKALRFLNAKSLQDISAKNYDAVVKQIESVNAARVRAKKAKEAAK